MTKTLGMAFVIRTTSNQSPRTDQLRMEKNSHGLFTNTGANDLRYMHFFSDPKFVILWFIADLLRKYLLMMDDFFAVSSYADVASE